METPPDLQADIRRWRVEETADGSVLVRGLPSRWWLRLLPGMVFVGIIVAAVVIGQMEHRGPSSGAPLLGMIAGAVSLAVVLLISLLIPEQWLTFSASGIRIETAYLRGLRTFRDVSWEDVVDVSLVDPLAAMQRIRLRLQGGRKADLSSCYWVMPEPVWNFILERASVPSPMREKLLRAADCAGRIERADDGTIRQLPAPDGGWILKNTADEVVVLGKGSSALLGGGGLYLLLFTVGPAISLTYQWMGEGTGTAVALTYGCLFIALLLHVALARERISATRDSLEVTRRSIFGTRTRRLGMGSIAIAAPRSGVWGAVCPHLVASCGRETLGLGFAFNAAQRVWLAKRLIALWSVAHITEPPREVR